MYLVRLYAAGHGGRFQHYAVLSKNLRDDPSPAVIPEAAFLPSTFLGKFRVPE